MATGAERHGLHRRGVAAALLVLAVSGAPGCTTGPSAQQRADQPLPVRVRREPPPPPSASADWQDFDATTRTLLREIDERDRRLQRGPIGNKAKELASLRLAASARDLVISGSLDGAQEALLRAVSLYGSNGYAYLWLAHVHHLQKRRSQALEFLDSAGHYLPHDRAVRAEYEGLRAAVGASPASGRSSRPRR